MIVTVLSLIVVVGSHLVRNHVVIVIVARRTVQNRVVMDIHVVPSAYTSFVSGS